MSAETLLIAENVAVLRQGVALLDTLESDVYARAGRFDPRSGIGAHFRHCIDFVTAFLDGLKSGRIDYSTRERDARLERERTYARDRMEDLARALETIDQATLVDPVMVRSEGAAVEGADVWSPSSIGRELQALSSHTIHHFALVAVLLRLDGVEPPESFGVAPATLAYWREQQCAR